MWIIDPICLPPAKDLATNFGLPYCTVHIVTAPSPTNIAEAVNWSYRWYGRPVGSYMTSLRRRSPMQSATEKDIMQLFNGCDQGSDSQWSPSALGPSPLPG